MNLDALQAVALACAQARSLDRVLQEVVAGLVEQEEVALARIWLEGPGDICSACPMRPECPDQTRCLHLVASAGGSLDGAEDWGGIDGRFRRFPLGVRKVGLIGSSAAPLLIHDVHENEEWIADLEWTQREKIRTFAGQPLVFRDRMLGVVAVFSRADIDEQQHRWLRAFADHAAVAIANAHAFEEIADLRARLEQERDYLREEVKEAQSHGEILGSSEVLKKVLRQITLVAPTDAGILLQGESGTGKELVARAIHEQSARRDRPLVRVNCASIPKDLFESEFFGHVRGAFTGALRNRVGRFQLAHGGTLFLDEVGEIPLELQSKLLRVLQEGEFERVGDDHTRKVDVRVIAATNRNLKAEAEAGRFRQDLFFRLSVFPMEIPPLRERKEDIAPLASHFLRMAAQRLNRPLPPMTRAQLLSLQGYAWPGNVRELQNVLERAVILSPADRLCLEMALPSPDVETDDRPADGESERPSFFTETEMRRREKDNLVAALRHAGWKVYGPGGAADLLGLKPSTLATRMRVLRIERPRRR